MTNEILDWILVSLAGAALGAIFFGGLWWTVRKGLTSKRPALLFLGSMLLRSGITVAGFYFLTGGELDKLLAGLLGFIIMRAVVMRLTGPPARRKAGAEVR